METAVGTQPAFINDYQARQIDSAVKAVARPLASKYGRQAYGMVWADFRRRYRVQNHHQLPAGLFDEALAWLNGRYQEAVR